MSIGAFAELLMSRRSVKHARHFRFAGLYRDEGDFCVLHSSRSAMTPPARAIVADGTKLPCMRLPVIFADANSIAFHVVSGVDYSNLWARSALNIFVVRR